MAIDSALKRRSAAGVPFLPLGPGVTPNASKPAAWRQSAGWGYAGIAASAPASATTITATWASPTATATWATATATATWASPTATPTWDD